MKYQVKPAHKLIKDYYRDLKEISDQNVRHEGAVRSAFQNLLSFTARKKGWTLIAELSDKVSGKTIRPDGTIRDKYGIPRGYWEAKDIDDDIDRAIKSKIAAKYPLTNIIFENTQTGVLYQDGVESFRADLSDKSQLVNLINSFYDYVEPAHESFDKAVAEFKERVKDLALGLNKIIKDAHLKNPAFQTAFESFFEICKVSLNPNISRDAVDEMIIQHLLTERLIRTIFNNPDFLNRNIIASEVEKVIDALTSMSFSRPEYLKELDRFYIAIEAAALTVKDFDEKMCILNTVYERFFQGYSVKVADTHGIVYTPEPIVDFMCASVEEALKTVFGKSLGDPDVTVLDPCTGTGSFVVNLLGRVKGRYLEDFYANRLFANEVMLMPYYIASLAIEHKYYERTKNYQPFEGICYVDTLDLVKGHQSDLFITESNTERIRRQRDSEITVIIGNPPYNVGQQNENDNNKNRIYKQVEDRIRETYAKDSKATNKNALWDAYVKFFRWASDRLNGKDGIVCFVSNNSFINDISFDGMRKHLAKDFDSIYLVDLKGNVRKGDNNNVFGMASMVGISISVLVKKHKAKKKLLLYEAKHKANRFEKFRLLTEANNINSMVWNKITPDARNNWIMFENDNLFQTFFPMGRKEAKERKWTDAKVLFLNYSNGVKTNRDAIVYGFSLSKLIERLKEQIDSYNGEVDRYNRSKSVNNNNIDNFVNYDVVQWSEGLKAKLKRRACQ